MQKYYTEHHLENSSLNNKDIMCIIAIALLIIYSAYFIKNQNNKNNVKVIEPYYQERFSSAPSKTDRFSNNEYEIAISKLLVDDDLRRIKYKVRDLNTSLNDFQSDLLKQQAMNDMILMLKKLKSGDLSEFDVNKMQQAVLEAGYGNIDEASLQKALDDYQNKVAQDNALQARILSEKQHTQDKIKTDSKDAVVLAKDIARELAEEEIEGFIDNISILARIGSFVVQKVSEE